MSSDDNFKMSSYDNFKKYEDDRYENIERKKCDKNQVKSYNKKDTSSCDKKDAKSYDDFSSLVYETLCRLPFFLIFIIIILYFIVSTDIYDKYVLYKMNKSFLENDNKTTSGVLVTGLIMGLLTSILFLANSSGYI